VCILRPLERSDSDKEDGGINYRVRFETAVWEKHTPQTLKMVAIEDDPKFSVDYGIFEE
jgi:hypothetical protein